MLGDGAGVVLLPDWLKRCAESFPERLALRYAEARWAFAELDQLVSRMARRLAGLGVHEGSRVALLAMNSSDFVMVVHALTRLGAVLVPLNVRLTAHELIWQIRDVEASLLVVDMQHSKVATEVGRALPELLYATLAAEALAGEYVLAAQPEAEVELRSEIALDAVQAIMYTSGTTGMPKGVMITYGMQWWNAMGSALNLGHQADDCWLACMPLFHIGGLSILMRSVIYGISVVLCEKFEASVVNLAIAEEGVTIISVVAAMLQRMLAELDTRDACYTAPLRCVLLGGGPAPRSLLEDCARRAIPVVQTYGLTESCSQAVTLAPADALRKLGSAGRPLLPVRLCIMWEGLPIVAGEVGMIMLKGPTITSGYVGRPEETARALQDGWLETGDLGYLDAEGYLYVLDRRSDLIISGGENVYPAEIEATLLAHPAVAEAGVCSVEDAHWGQVPIAFVSLHSGSQVSVDELLTHARERLARYKLPRMVYIVEHLPRNAAGKLVRRELVVLAGQQ